MLERQEKFEVVQGIEKGKYVGTIRDLNDRSVIMDDGEEAVYINFTIEFEDGSERDTLLSCPFPVNKKEIGTGSMLYRLMDKAGFDFEKEDVDSTKIMDLFYGRKIEFYLNEDKNGFLKIIDPKDIRFVNEDN